MDIVVMSREIIKPSSPTPNHLRNLKLSFMDQHQAPNSYISVLLFYSAQGDADRFKETRMSDRLKKSLSETLTKFYPIAGRINRKEWIIDCNDDGLEYVETRVTGTLNQVLSCPKADELNQLIPKSELLSAVQVGVFDCGGMAIGVAVSHEAGDASSLATFINSWAAIARGANETVPPKFGFESLFPPAADVPAISIPPAMLERIRLQRLVSKRFVFNSSKLAALKAICANVVQSPTRVEVVTALLFKCFINGTKSISSKPSVISMPVNLRDRMCPALPQHSFGNLAIRLTSPPWPTEREPELRSLVGQLRDTIRKINVDYVDKLLADSAILLSRKLKEDMETWLKGDLNILAIFCSCRLPFYETDFGWGMPTWATRFYVQFPNVHLLDTKKGDGIEAWVTLEEEDMARFCSEEDLLDFACENSMIHESITKP